MKNEILRKLRHFQVIRKPWIQNDAIRLRVKRVYFHVKELGNADCVVFEIIENQRGTVAGEIALRIGESEALFYLGHIGYHIDAPYRGQHFARRACELCRPLLKALGQSTVVITTDDDNLPSIKTCEGLDCVLESTVNVPLWCMEEFGISSKKRRYIFWTA